MPNSIKICTLLMFFGINLRFAAENIINVFIFFINMESGSPDAPCIPEMYVDVIMVITFAIAYMFIAPGSSGKNSNDVHNHLHEESGERYREIIRQIKNYVKTTGYTTIARMVHHESNRKIKYYVRWTKKAFFLCIVGCVLYLFSKYVLSIGLEVFNIENDHADFILNTFNDSIKTYSSLVFVYVYCRYLSTNRIINTIIYIFFFIRNIFGTNIMELMTNYDTYIVVPFLDIVTTVIFIYAIYYSITSYRGTFLSKIIGTRTVATPQTFTHSRLESL